MPNEQRGFGPQEVRCLALIGNPGSGKSTILNGLAGKAIFESGISIGEGLTTAIQVWEENGIMLIDTPGLEDAQRKEAAGKELDKMLAKNIPIKMAFVVTLEHGRVRPADCVTIDLVLSAIENADTNNKFGVIINQVSAGILRHLEENPRKEAVLRKQITRDRNTSHWFKIPLDRDLEDVPNGQIKVTEELLAFFLGLPETKPADAAVKEIDTKAMDRLVEELAAYIQELEQSNQKQLNLLRRQLRAEQEEAAKRNMEMMQLMVEMVRSKRERSRCLIQ